jgi:hypothetical protein
MNAKRNRYLDPRGDHLVWKQPKKPLCCNLPTGLRVVRKFKAPVPASTPFTSLLQTPFPHVANRGQVSKVTSSIRFVDCTAGSIVFISVYNSLQDKQRLDLGQAAAWGVSV